LFGSPKKTKKKTPEKHRQLFSRQFFLKPKTGMRFLPPSPFEQAEHARRWGVGLGRVGFCLTLVRQIDINRTTPPYLTGANGGRSTVQQARPNSSVQY
jgi:hypothetical protein